MVKTLGIIFIGILISIVPFAGSLITNNNFLMTFVQNQSLGIMATILALNVTSVTFMVGTLISIEIRVKKTIFKKTREEMRDNIVFMMVIFLINLAVVLTNKKGLSFVFNGYSIDVTAILNYVSTLLLVLTIIAMYEIVHSVFQIKNFLENDEV